MLKGIAYTTMYVSDQDQALSFYTEALGLENRVDNPTAEGPRFLTVGVEGQDTQLVLWPGTPGAGQAVDGRVPASCTIEVEDCREAVATLKSRGVSFETDVLEFPWGRSRSSSTPTATASRCARAGRKRAGRLRRRPASVRLRRRADGVGLDEPVAVSGVGGARGQPSVAATGDRESP